MSATSAGAIEALDGRVQFHGFTELQLRALDEKFSQELDLAQWYNVLNLELELDIAPDGIGPIDLMSAYIRAEARYDAIYNEGFYIFPSINTYGDNSEDLPKRLRDGKDREMGGVIRATDRFGKFKTQRISDRDPTTIVPPVINIPPQNLDLGPGLYGTPPTDPINYVPNVAAITANFPDGLNVAAGGPDQLSRDGRRSDKGMRRGYPGFDTFFTQAGPDNQFGTPDDPARYVHEHVADFAFTFRDFRGPIGNDNLIMGPWLPKNFIRANALNTDRGNPFRGRIAPTPPMRHLLQISGVPDPGPPATNNLNIGDVQLNAIRFHEGDQIVNPAALAAMIPTPAPGELSFAAVDLLDPVLARVLTAPDNVLLDLRGLPSNPGPSARVPLNTTFPGRYTLAFFTSTGLTGNTFLTDDYGGDFMGGVVPCTDPTLTPPATQIREGLQAADPLAQCIESSSTDGGPGTPGNGGTDPGAPAGSYTAPGLVRMPGGLSRFLPNPPFGPRLETRADFRGETPFRPAPDLPNLGQRLLQKDSAGNITDLGEVQGLNSDHELAQGLYIPSKGALREIRSDHLDSLQFNYDEVDRSWNRGQAQQNNKELKEAYADVEVLDSRLWMRFGLQNIVWGKTELFRTTDQFNPQDLALASLPSLEESRIALWSARFVYSLYDVGPLEDVRAEFAFNFDQYQPNDLGACGEPFTPDLVCSLTNGIFAHSLLGLGIVGIDRPESPWKDLSDLEFGGRIEWRWDRFSFALIDFWGFSDFPHPEAQYYYERNVDFDTGRPLVGRLPHEQPGKCGVFAGERALDNMNASSTDPTLGNTPYVPTTATGFQALNLSYNSSFASHPLSVTTGAPQVDGISIVNKRGGIGRDPDCLRPGGAPGSSNAFAFDQDILAKTNALQNHHANQQIFAWICAGTVGIAASLDAGSCAWTIFATDAVLNSQLLPISFVESLTALMAGEQTGSIGPQHFMSLIATNTKGAIDGAALRPLPLASLNQLYNNPLFPFDRNANGVVDRTNCDDATNLANCDLGGFDGFDGRVQITGRNPQPLTAGARNFITLDRALTNEQRALLGCGPFYGSRCDSSLRFRDSARTTYFGSYGGLDFMNMEASALVQSWPGVDGTREGHTSTSTAIQPGTVGWVPTFDEEEERFNNGIGGPICTRFNVDENRELKLPGCRGVKTLQMGTATNGSPVVFISFEAGYLPSIDGCVIGTQVNRGVGQTPVQVLFDPNEQPNPSAQLVAELQLCNGAKVKQGVPNEVIRRDLTTGAPILNPATGLPLTSPNPECTGAQVGPVFPTGLKVCNARNVTLQDLPLIHPVAGCVASDVHFAALGPNDCSYWMHRNLVNELFNGTAQLFQNELAAFSWNFLMFLTLTSCNITSFDLDGNDHRVQNGGPRDLGPSPNVPGSTGDPGCFDPSNAYTAGRCSIASPMYCSNVKGFFSAAGVTRNTALAGGNSRFGRRTFIWQSGGELTLEYQQRNVLGLSSDFSEDVTKTNWGVEFTWIEDVPQINNDSLVGLSHTDALNLTVSVDRPTFINFLNPNRTFFFNSQWFFSYLTDYEDGFVGKGPWNVLFTFAMFTGYFQDRVQPQFVTIYDFRSQSGGLLPSLQYRFTESFSVTVGMLYFFGHTDLTDMGVREYAPAANRSGHDAYENGQDNGLALIRQRDEVFMRLRWTF
ncbi:MAG TPA: DUF1302 family protein [Myxococcota bacterium]|nr:DUF1302 family protein [Myxococcota bacterium]